MIDLRPTGFVVGWLVSLLGLTMAVPMAVDLRDGARNAEAFFVSAAIAARSRHAAGVPADDAGLVCLHGFRHAAPDARGTGSELHRRVLRDDVGHDDDRRHGAHRARDTAAQRPALAGAAAMDWGDRGDPARDDPSAGTQHRRHAASAQCRLQHDGQDPAARKGARGGIRLALRLAHGRLRNRLRLGWHVDLRRGRACDDHAGDRRDGELRRVLRRVHARCAIRGDLLHARQRDVVRAVSAACARPDGTQSCAIRRSGRS